jgi:hypothetical protein
MDTQTLPKPDPNAAPVYRSYPAQVEPEPAPVFSAGFVIFAVLVIGAGAYLGCLKSGKVPLPKFLTAPNAVARPAAHAVLSVPPAAPPVAPLNPASFVVTSISLGQPSYAIINGTSHAVGDAVEAPGVTGWKVARIVDGTVWLQNGATFAALPLSTPGIKPLDDTLHPLN